MPHRCCVPKCSSNTKKNDNYVSTFFFPKDEKRKKLWIKKINRANFVPNSTSSVCIVHFHNSFIIKKPADNSKKKVKTRPTLTKDAYPSIFPNQPKYLSSIPASNVHDPKRRYDRIKERDKSMFNEWDKNDIIASFESFTNTCQSKLYSGWTSILSTSAITFIKIDLNDDNQDCPRMKLCIKISTDLTVKAFVSNSLLSNKKTNFILGTHNKCDRWSKLDTLLSFLNGCDQQETTEEKLINCAKTLHDISQEESMSDKYCQEKIKFIAEQLSLSLSSTPRYSVDTLIWSCMIYHTHPSSYRQIRNSNSLSLPHPKYLDRLTRNMASNESGMHDFHVKYLENRFANLNDQDKYVCLLIDEIHVQPQMNFSGGAVSGYALNSNEEATALQTFMISSYFSSYKDVVSIYPVKCMTASSLLQWTQGVLKVLQGIGYKVLAIISDNNRVNRSMFTELCGGVLQNSTPNPYDPDETLYLLFDTVHIFKSVRNNWLNQKGPFYQKFIYPNPNKHSEQFSAKIQDLKTIYEQEKCLTIKQAPALSEKVLYPNAFERQNVKFAVRLFDEKNITTLKTFKSESCHQTAVFLEYINQWWQIVNVKTPTKGRNKRNDFANPIKCSSVADENLIFLKDFLLWLQEWEKMNSNCARAHNGKLTADTFLSLKQTTSALINICDHLFNNVRIEYILLGKFQTDDLEGRFGMYRQLCGANYNVSVQQVLDAERKLKVKGLLKVSSSAGDFKILSLNCSDVDDTEFSLTRHQTEVTEPFNDIIQLVDEDDIAEEQQDVLIYIAGYVAKTAARYVKCSNCRAILMQDRSLETSFEAEGYNYMKIIDRGGLKIPTKIVITICAYAKKIFEIILESSEDAFKHCRNQRNVLINLVERRIVYLNHQCANCGASSEPIYRKCIFSMVNILLNNYCKNKNNAIRCSKKRKLSTLS